MLLSHLTQISIINGEQGIVTLKLDFKDNPNQGDVKLWTFQSGIATNVILKPLMLNLKAILMASKKIQLIP